MGIEGRPSTKKATSPRSPIDWSNLPLAQFPVPEARKYIDQWSNVFEQLKFAARRQTCNWNYTLPEQKEEAIELRLPDLQVMRNWARLQAIKVRVEIAEHKYDEAVQTIETGIAFGQHVGEGPVVINTLVGVACAEVMLGGVEELIAQPDSPNLYWALHRVASTADLGSKRPRDRSRDARMDAIRNSRKPSVRTPMRSGR